MQGCPCTARKYPAYRQLAKEKRIRKRGSEHTDQLFCLPTEAIVDPASWICPIASQWLWREAQQSQVSTSRLASQTGQQGHEHAEGSLATPTALPRCDVTELEEPQCISGLICCPDASAASGPVHAAPLQSCYTMTCVSCIPESSGPSCRVTRVLLCSAPGKLARRQQRGMARTHRHRRGCILSEQHAPEAWPSPAPVRSALC